MLLIKTSSLGDIIHTLPAVTDLATIRPEITVDWVIERSFACVPTWHPGIRSVISVDLRSFRKHPFSKKTFQGIRENLKDLRSHSYDAIIDAQGLIKSAGLAVLAKGKRYGFDKASIRECCAAWCYHESISVPCDQHAISRVRQLFAKVLGYSLPQNLPRYGISLTLTKEKDVHSAPYLVFLHGTRWPTKQWPEAYWRALFLRAVREGYEVWLGGIDEIERQRGMRIIKNETGGRLLPLMSLEKMAEVIKKANGVVTVDTGLGHLAVALGVGTVALYGPTSPKLTGTLGKNQVQQVAHFPCAPCLQRTCHYKGQAYQFPACLETVHPEAVWAALMRISG
ncbi:MAG: lipopolysaccharide heptosyltransferase I [Gammaproteobacteria bacterium]|nr:lipopolysaccharide heptosyltransferase I [Gammaproteobacteria bacterium]